MRQFEINPRLLKPNPWNTNSLTGEAKRKLDESIKKFGMFKPIVVRELSDGSLEILGGAHRHESALALDLTAVPVISLGPIDDAKAKQISLVDNARYGTDDAIQLAKLMEELGSTYDLAEYLPYSVSELDSIFSSVNIDFESLALDDEEEDPEEKPRTRPAKTHQIMRFRLSIEDAERIAALIKDAKKINGFNEEDELTNAGDALVHLLFRSASNDE